MSEAQTVILYRQGEQDYITFGNGQPIEVKIVESVPLEIQGQAQQVSVPDLVSTTQYIVVPSDSGAIDRIDLGTQIGRLDFVSALLASLGVALIFGGIFAWIRFSTIARETAKKVSEELMPKMVEDKVRELVPDLVANQVPFEIAAKVSGENGIEITDDVADSIAAAFREEN